MSPAEVMSGPSQEGGARLFGANIDVIGETWVRGFRGFEVYLSVTIFRLPVTRL